MDASLLLTILAALGTMADIEVIPYNPRVTEQSLEGKITTSTFALETPNCVFDDFVNSSDSIWLVVTFSNVTGTFQNPMNPQRIPPYEDLYTAFSYMTMRSTVSQFPCSPDQSRRVLRVGNESACKNDDGRTNCNSPLPSPGTYRVKFLVMNSTGARAETRWSAPIELKKAQAWQTVDTWPGRRSGDMIVITVILSALCSVVTISFLSTVCYECFKLWRHGPPPRTKRSSAPSPSRPAATTPTTSPRAPDAPPAPRCGLACGLAYFNLS